MQVFEQLMKLIPEVFGLLGQKVPPWVWITFAIVLVLYLASSSVTFALSFWKNTKDQLAQLRNPEQKERRIRRQTFAEHVEQEIRRLSLKEDWKDRRFTELEAEVEAEGYRKIFDLIPFAYFLNRAETSLIRSDLRREKSLSKALERSRDRLILVEGDPGSGKSVALRHVALKMASHAKKSRSTTSSIIPIYVNLKELERPLELPINRQLIEDFILKSLKRINDRDVDQFLDEEFHVGLKNGTWFFLFDSFDELPEVLSSTEADLMVKRYSDAIADFLQGMNRCRGVVASRQFRGPAYFGWPRFRILPLSEPRRLQLIRRSDLTRKLANELAGQLGNARSEIISMAGNPLFLNLLCEHMKSGQPFPLSTHTVFETYVGNRFTRDQKRLKQRFGLDIAQIRMGAENIAYCMSADSGLSLSPTRESLHAALIRHNLDSTNNFTTLLDALEFIKLARSDEVAEIAQTKSFTFAHRRFQEYFATCVVLRMPSLIPAQELLTNARWRETAVVMCQLQPIDKLTPLIEHAEHLLTQFCNSTTDLINTPLEYVSSKELNATTYTYQQRSIRDSFSWPSQLHHLLGLLQDGFISRLMELPESIKIFIGKLTLSASEERPLDDRKWALEVSGIVPEAVLAYMLKRAFADQSQWLKEVAYRQAARLSIISPAIAQGMRNAIIDLMFTGRLHHEKHATKAHLSRLYRSASKKLLSTLRLLLYLPTIDLVWQFILGSVLLLIISGRQDTSWLISALALCIFFSISYVSSWILLNHYIPGFDKDFNIMAVIMLKLMTVLFCSFFIIRIRIINTKEAELFVLFLILLIWYIPLISIAVWAGGTGFCTFWFLWAFIPFWPLLWLPLYLCARFPSIISFLLDRKNWPRIVRIALDGIVIFTLLLIIAAALILLDKFARSIMKSASTIELIITAAALIVVLLVLIYLFIQDWWHLYIWKESHQEQTTCQEMLEIALRFHLPFIFCPRLLRSIQERRMLPATKETEELLKQATFEIEVEQRLYKVRQETFVGSFTSWVLLRRKSRYTKLVSSVASSQIIDELYRLLEDIRIRRNSA